MTHCMRCVSTLLWLLVTTVGCASKSVYSQDKMQISIDSPPGQYVHTGARQMHINCSGHGKTTVVLESGLGSTSLDWLLVQEKIAAHTRVCSYDRSGYGWSDRSSSVRVVSTMAKDLDRLLLMAGEKPPFMIVGHSFGGLIAQYFADEFAQKTAAVVLVDSTHPEQFRVFDNAGIPTPQAPNGGMFFVRNFASVPDALPEQLKPLATQLAAQRKSVEALYNELRTLRRNAELVQRKVSSPLPVKSYVISRASRVKPGSEDKKKLRETVWRDLQQDLALRNETALSVANTSDHFVHLAEPDAVVEIILQALRTSE